MPNRKENEMVLADIKKRFLTTVFVYALVKIIFLFQIKQENVYKHVKHPSPHYSNE